MTPSSNEVYLTDVVVPGTDWIGDVGAGWTVARTTLMNERVSLGGSGRPRGSGPIKEAVRLYRKAAAVGRAGAPERDRLMKMWVQAEVARLTNLRAATARREGGPGPEGSVAKLQMAEGNKALQELCVDLLGASGQLMGVGRQPVPIMVQGGVRLSCQPVSTHVGRPGV